MSAVFGYAALSRFLLPAAAIVCVLAGIGVVWAGTALSAPFARARGRRRGRRARERRVRVAAFPALFDEVELRDHLVQELDSGDRPRRRRGRGRRVRAHRDRRRPTCLASALAWKLDVPMAAHRPLAPGSRRGRRSSGTARTGLARGRVERRFAATR